MASFRQYPSQSSFVPPPAPPNQNPQYPPNQHRGFSGTQPQATPYVPPPPPPPPTSYNSSNNHQNSNAHHPGYGSTSYQYGPPIPQQQQYPYLQPPPQNQLNSQPQPPPPMYYPYNVPPPPPAAPPPPPPSSPPPSSSIPPPPPSNPPPSHPPPPSSSSNPPPPHYSKETRAKHGIPPNKQHKPSATPLPHGRAPHVPNGPAGRVETEEERRLRKKMQYEKQKQEEKQKQILKDSQNTVLHKTQNMTSSAMKGSLAGLRIGDKRTPFLTADRVENRLKKPTTFLCKLKFRNELPDPTAQPKLLSLNTNKDQYTRYAITTLEKMHKPKLFVEPDLGIPLDLLDLNVYNPPSTRLPLAPEDEELLRDTEFTTPVKQNGIRRKERPNDLGMSWLVKTQYISPLSTDQAKTSLTEKQAKELRETKGGRNILENLNNRESQIKAIEASFEACKAPPVHATNNKLQPVEVLPLLPDFDRYDDPFVLASFDNDPTADAEDYSKLDRSICDDIESQAIMKSFVGNGSDPARPEKFLAYMVPSTDELSKDIYDEQEAISYTWIREYNWDVRGDDADDPTTYLVTFNEDAAHYLPLATKLVLRKKRAKEGRSNEEIEHYPVPSRITVRHRPTVAVVEEKESRGYTNPKQDTLKSKRGRSSSEDAFETRHKVARLNEMDHFSEAEEDELSE